MCGRRQVAPCHTNRLMHNTLQHIAVHIKDATFGQTQRLFMRFLAGHRRARSQLEAIVQVRAVQYVQSPQRQAHKSKDDLTFMTCSWARTMPPLPQLVQLLRQSSHLHIARHARQEGGVW